MTKPKEKDLLLAQEAESSSLDLVISQLRSITYKDRKHPGVYGSAEMWTDDNAEELADRIEAYFEWCKEFEKPYTLTGLCRTAGFASRSSLYRMLEDGRSVIPAQIIRLSLQLVEEQHETGLSTSRNVTGHIFALKNCREPWADQQVEKPQFTFVVENPMPSGSREIRVDEAIEVEATDVTADPSCSPSGLLELPWE